MVDDKAHLDTEARDDGPPTPAEVPAPAHRPSGFNQEIADTIIELVCAGYPLRTIIAHPKCPSKSTLMRWLSDHPEFNALYVKARDFQVAKIADDIIHIADARRPDKDGKIDYDAIALPRPLSPDEQKHQDRQIGTRFRLLAAVQPKMYGEQAIEENRQQVLAQGTTQGDNAKQIDQSENGPLVESWLAVVKGLIPAKQGT
jgi:hypothetical protein